MDVEGINFVSDIFEDIVIYAVGCSCTIIIPDTEDTVGEKVFIVV